MKKLLIVLLCLGLAGCGYFESKQKLAEWVKTSIQEDMNKNATYDGIEVVDVILVRESINKYSGLVTYKYGENIQKVSVIVTVDGDQKIYQSDPPQVLIINKGLYLLGHQADIVSNDALAKATLRAISTATETYATANQGHYPTSSRNLTDATPPYLNNDYCQKTIAGYVYNCTFSDSGYQIIATPVTIGSSGSAVYTISTGGVLQPGG